MARKIRKVYKTCRKCGCATFHIPSGQCSQCGYRPANKSRGH